MASAPKKYAVIEFDETTGLSATIEMNGFSGPSCMDAAKLFDSLGANTAIKQKPEFFERNQKVGINVKTGRCG